MGQLVRGYRALLSEKRRELTDGRDKLSNGLAKLDESRTQVERMGKELAVKKDNVAAKAKDCDDLLVVIVSERRIADEQKNKVEMDSERCVWGVVCVLGAVWGPPPTPPFRAVAAAMPPCRARLCRVVRWCTPLPLPPARVLCTSMWGWSRP